METTTESSAWMRWRPRHHRIVFPLALLLLAIWVGFLAWMMVSS